MGGTKFKNFLNTLKSVDEIALWSIVLFIFLILMLVGQFAIPSISKYINDNIGVIVISVLFIFLRLTYLYQQAIKSMIEVNKKEIDSLLKTRFSDKTKVIFNRDDYYRITYENIKNAPKGTKILVTNFEKIDISYDTKNLESSGYEYEKKLMEIWDQRVKDGDLNVKQVVGVWSVDQVNEVLDRIEKFEKAGNYRLNITKGDTPPVIVSSFVLEDSLALLEFPSDTANPHMSNQALVSTDKDFIKLCKSYFDVLWANSTLVKSSDGKRDANIDSLVFYGEKKEDFESICDNFSDILTDRKKPIGMKKIAEEILNECEYVLESIRNGAFSLSKEEFEKLITITLHTNKNIKCTSYLQNKEFWNGSFGNEIMDSNKVLLEEGISITRIFILTKEEIEDPIIIGILNKQYDMGIDVRHINQKFLSKFFLFDFSIHDDRIVFEQYIDNTGSLVENRISCNHRELNKFKKIFYDLYSKSQQYIPDKIEPVISS